MRLRAVTLVFTMSLVTLGLTSCGGDPDPVAVDPGADAPAVAASVATSPKPTEPVLPSCEEVWVDGQKLPNGYKGCVDASGATVKAERQECSFGVPLVTYAGKFYASAGNRINDEGVLKSSAAYQRARSSCTG